MKPPTDRTRCVAKESMSYGMPTYAMGGEMVCAFASQKHYLAFYVCDTKTVAKFRSELGTRDCGKCCIRYRRAGDAPLPVLEKVLRAAVKAQRG